MSPAAGNSWRSHVVLWLLCAAVVLTLHIPFLRLPYFWDEAGYFVPAARELAEHGRLLPETTVANPHPPLVSLYLAAAWKIFGFHPLVTRIAMALIAATAVYALLLVAMRMLPATAGLWAAALFIVAPLFFAQSTLAHLDVAATAATLLALYFFLRGRIVAYIVTVSVLCLTKETGVGVVLALALVRRRPEMFLPLLPLAGWFTFLRLETGHWLGDPAFLDYNLQNALHPARFLMALLCRAYYLFIADFRWLLALPLALAWRYRKPPASRLQPVLWLVLAAHTLTISLLGGALQNRYLLPALALFYLLAVQAWWNLELPRRGLLPGALLAAHMACWFWNPPYPFPYEENLAYADFVRLHQGAAENLALLPPGIRVLTAWPATDELTRPELGYTNRRVRVVPLEDFSEESFNRVRPEDFDVVFLYSREWQPSWNLLEKAPFLGDLRRRLYGTRPPAAPEWVRLKFNLNSLGAVHLRGQWTEWLARGELRRVPVIEARSLATP